MAHIEDVLLWSLMQGGEKYVFGAEVPLKADDSDRWDCSELVEWSCGKAGVKPWVPDGAYYQWKHCTERGMALPVSRGMAIRGALLFVGDGTGVGRDAITHVAWSLGDGTTIEARGKRWGVGSWPSAARFDFAALVPGVDYSARQPLPPEEFDMDEIRLREIIEDANDKQNMQLVAAVKGLIDGLEKSIKAHATTIRDGLRDLIKASG